MKKLKPETRLILLDLRSAQNVGAIFRTAEGAGVAKIYLAGYTPAPIDRFGRVNREIAKTALGAEKLVPGEKVVSTTCLLKKLRSAGYQIIAVEQDPQALDYRKLKSKANEKIVFVFGNEVTGLPKSLLAKVDQIIEIPMRGQKESLNVSVAAGIILFRYF